MPKQEQQFNLQDKVTLAQILQLPNVLQNNTIELNEKIEAEILQAVSLLSIQLIETQKTEGALLAIDIKEQLASMQIKIVKIQSLSIELIKEKKENLKCLLETKKTTLLYEIEKIDINEETVRFNSHLTNLASQFETEETAKGKKIDFIIQELNREINTIAAKCSNIAISSLAIDIKSELEKAREQAQNII